VVSEYYEVSIEDIRSKKRKGNIDQARCVIIYLGHLLTNESILAICFSVGRRDEQIIRRTVSMIDERETKMLS
jgi:chromosomal replication initiation ATPase DnaA